MNPFSFARVIPEFDKVMDILFKERSEILSYGNKLDLIEVRWRINISNNYDIWSIIHLNYLINSISDCK